MQHLCCCGTRQRASVPTSDGHGADAGTAAAAAGAQAAEAAPPAPPAKFDAAFVRGELGQGHLLEGRDEAAVAQIVQQLAALDAQYPGGLKQYIASAKKLLQDSKDGVNPYEGFSPSVPEGMRLDAGSSEFDACEALGMENAGCTGFVLVAGGLGERLGYGGIKVALPNEVLTDKCFLRNYCEAILALQARARAGGAEGATLPLAIMTSGDTHDRTVALLAEHGNFGLADGQITLMKQEKVPALMDNEARFAQNAASGLVETKPHGHGDVHSLIHGKGVLEAWAALGVKWVCFIQDTNGLVFRALPAAVGVSAKNDFDVNSLTVPRKPGEAVGGICRLDSAEGGSSLTINVEYNQLDPLLRGTTSPEGDVADASGFSPYPGNINVLVFKLASYKRVLDSSGGSIPEFVNPKYADAAKTTFKKPTRLECMMQDYPKLLAGDPNAKVGFTQMERFMCFSAVKNNPADAKAKLAGSGFAESASSGEADVYTFGRYVLAQAGVDVQTEGLGTEDFLGLPVPKGAKVVLAPSFGTTLAELKARFPSAKDVSISDTSSLYIEGDVTVRSLKLDGDLSIVAAPGEAIVVDGLDVTNDGVVFQPVDPDADDVDEVYRIRGYVKVTKGTHSITK